MAKRSRSTLDDQPTVKVVPIEVELGIDPPPKVIYNKVVKDSVKRVVNQYPARIIRNVNGTRYEWQPGQTIEVKSEDTDALRNLTMGGRPCCGHSPSIILQVLED